MADAESEFDNHAHQVYEEQTTNFPPQEEDSETSKEQRFVKMSQSHKTLTHKLQLVRSDLF